MLRLFKLVMDLDSTLIWNDEKKELAEYSFFNLKDGKRIYMRPGFIEFLIYIQKTFDEIYVYTAAGESYANDIVNNLFPKNFVKKIWHYTSCTIYDDNVHKMLESELDDSYTLMIDDRVEVVHLNTHVKDENFFQITPFYGGRWENFDKSILYIRDWKMRKM